MKGNKTGKEVTIPRKKIVKKKAPGSSKPTVNRYKDYLIYGLTILALILRLVPTQYRGFLYEREATAALCASSWALSLTGSAENSINRVYKPGLSNGPAHELFLAPASFAGGVGDHGSYHLLTACAGAALVPLSGMTATYLAGPPAGVTAAMLVAFSPSLIFWSAGAMPQAFSLLLLLSSMLLWRGGWFWSRQLISGLLFGLALSSNLPVLSVAPVFLIFGLFRLRSNIVPFVAQLAGVLISISGIEFLVRSNGGIWIERVLKGNMLFPSFEQKMMEIRMAMAEFPAYVVHSEGAPAAFICAAGLAWSLVTAFKRRSLEPLFWSFAILTSWLLPVLYSDTRPGCSALSILVGLILGASALVSSLSLMAKRSTSAANTVLLTILIFSTGFAVPSILETLSLHTGYQKAFELCVGLKGNMYSTSPAIVSFYSGIPVKPDRELKGVKRFSREKNIFIEDWRIKRNVPESLKLFATLPNSAGTSPFAYCEDKKLATSEAWTSSLKESVKPSAAIISIYNSR